MKATINDVARHAGVSKATVSRVLNGYQNVAEPLRERVKLSIRALDYRPSAIARDLSIGQTKLIGVLVPDSAVERNAQLLRGVEDRASENGYLVLLRNTDGHGERAEESIARLAGQNVAGIVSVSSAIGKAELPSLLSSGIPCVHCNNGGASNTMCEALGVESIGIDSVGVDEAAMARHAVTYLKALGHRAIVFLSDKSSDRCLGGYQDAMRDNGLTPAVYPNADGYDTVQAAIQDAMFSPQRATAFICMDGEASRTATAALYRFGFSIPEDASIIALGDVSRGEGQRFLTTISLPAYEIGLDAVDLLLGRINGARRRPEQRLLPTTLKTRRSCAAAQLGATLQISSDGTCLSDSVCDETYAEQYG